MDTATAKPRKRRAWVVVTVALGAVVLPFVGIRIFSAATRTCSDQERAVFLEFPQFGGMVLQPGSDIESGGCVASFQTADRRDDVIRYYKRQLEQHGWTMQDIGEPAPGAGPEPGGGGSEPASVVLSTVPSCAPSEALCAGSLDATRGSFSFNVSFEATEGSTSVVVRVSQTEE